MLLFWAFLFPTNAQAIDKLVVATGEWAPYLSEDLPHGGFATRICTAAFALAGIEVTYKYLPWKRSYLATQSMKYDATLGWHKTPEREKTFLFSEPILSETTYFYYRKDAHLPTKTVADLKGKTVGVTLGYANTAILRPIVERHGGTIDIAPNDVSNLKKLVKGRIHLFPCSEIVFNSLAKTHLRAEELELLERSKDAYYVGDHHFIVSRKHPNALEIIDKFDKGLKLLKESGLYNHYWEESLEERYLPMQ